MIKANELRIGNYFFDADGNEKKINYSDLVSLEITCLHYNPIPLTPGKLERCSFNFDEVQINILGHDYEFVFDKEGLKYGYHGEGGFIRETREPILYLHQFQNLIFDLAGEELEINLNG